MVILQEVTFTRLSHPMQLISYRLVISPVSNSLMINGTEVKCTDFENQESSSTVISVVNAQSSSTLIVSVPHL